MFSIFFVLFLKKFYNCYLAVPRPTFGHSQGDSLTNPVLITAFVPIWPEGHREPRNEVGSLSPAERLAGFEPGTFRFLLQRLNPLSIFKSKQIKTEDVKIKPKRRSQQCKISGNSSNPIMQKQQTNHQQRQWQYQQPAAQHLPILQSPHQQNSLLKCQYAMRQGEQLKSKH